MSGRDGFFPAMSRRSGAALKVVAQRLAHDPVDFRVVAATKVLQGVNDFGRKAKGDVFHDPVSPQHGEDSVMTTLHPAQFVRVICAHVQSPISTGHRRP